MFILSFWWGGNTFYFTPLILFLKLKVLFLLLSFVLWWLSFTLHILWCACDNKNPVILYLYVLYV